PGSECCAGGGDDHGEAYTAVVQGGRLSRESSNIAEAEALVLPKAICAAPLCEGPTLCRGRRPHHAAVIYIYLSRIGRAFRRARNVEQQTPVPPERRHGEPRLHAAE